VIITCPECASEFDVPFAMIGLDGRTVRCASCRHEWHAGPPKREEPPVSPYKKIETPISATGFEIEFDIFKNRHDAPEFMPDSRPARSAKASSNKKTKSGKAMADLKGLPARKLVASLVITVLLTTLFGTMAPILASASPLLSQVYRGFGIKVPIPGEGLGIDRLQLKTSWEGHENKIQVTTRLSNLTESAQKVPPLVLHAIGEGGKPTGQTWEFEPPVKTLEPQQGVPFVMTLPEIPKNTGEILTLQAEFAS